MVNSITNKVILVIPLNFEEEFTDRFRIVKFRDLCLPLEPLGFYRQQMFDVSTACEDAFQIDPTTLDINPNIKQSHDPIQLVFPTQGIFLKHL